MDLNKIHCGDALDLFPKLDHKPNLIIMSPPDLAETPFSFEEYREFLKKAYKLASDSLSDTGILASITTDRKMNRTIYSKHIDIINATPMTLFNHKIWAKNLKCNLFIQTFSHALFFRKGVKATNNKLVDFLPDVWLIPVDKTSWYPTKDSFPTELVRRIILNCSNENDVVLDPFMGSGKTARVCISNKRNFIGFELDTNMVDLATKHLND